MFTVASLLSARLNMSVELHAASKMKKKKGGLVYSYLLKLRMAIWMSRILTVPSLLTSALGFQFGEDGLVLNSRIRYWMSLMLHVPS